VTRSVGRYEEIVYQTHVIIGPIAFGRIDDAQLRTIHGNFRLDVFTHYYVIEIRDLLLPLFDMLLSSMGRVENRFSVR
jgi:hypothetical protein